MNQTNQTIQSEINTLYDLLYEAYGMAQEITRQIRAVDNHVKRNSLHARLQQVDTNIGDCLREINNLENQAKVILFQDQNQELLTALLYDDDEELTERAKKNQAQERAQKKTQEQLVRKKAQKKAQVDRDRQYAKKISKAEERKIPQIPRMPPMPQTRELTVQPKLDNITGAVQRMILQDQKH